MNKKIKRTLIGVGLVAILLGSSASFSEPGSEKDPLVTMSYVNDKIEHLKQYIDGKLMNNGKENNTSNDLLVVELLKGQYLIGKGGTEIILRGGIATAHGVKIDQGLTDITEGIDIDNNESVLSPNHLIIIPRDDGRGAYAVSDSIFLVRGDYNIK